MELLKKEIENINLRKKNTKKSRKFNGKKKATKRSR